MEDDKDEGSPTLESPPLESPPLESAVNRSKNASKKLPVIVSMIAQDDNRWARSPGPYTSVRVARQSRKILEGRGWQMGRMGESP